MIVLLDNGESRTVGTTLKSLVAEPNGTIPPVPVLARAPAPADRQYRYRHRRCWFGYYKSASNKKLLLSTRTTLRYYWALPNPGIAEFQRTSAQKPDRFFSSGFLLVDETNSSRFCVFNSSSIYYHVAVNRRQLKYARNSKKDAAHRRRAAMRSAALIYAHVRILGLTRPQPAASGGHSGHGLTSS